MRLGAGAGGKEQVVDRVPKRIKELQFGIMSNQDIVNQAVLEVSDRNIYDIGSSGSVRKVTRHGPLDGRMGTSDKSGECETCGADLQKCNGHFGHIQLALPAFHIGYLKKIIEVLHVICKNCSRVLLSEDERRKHLRQLRRPNLDNMQRTRIYAATVKECKKCKLCPYCGAVNGAVRRAPGHPLKIIHIKYSAFLSSTAKSKVAPPCKVTFDNSFKEARKGNSELDKHIRKAVDDLNPLRALNLMRRISNTDCELLGIDPSEGRPETFIWQYVPVPPVSIRPSVAQESATTEDDITNKLGDIIQISGIIKASLDKGQPIQTIMEQWDFLQLQVAMYVNSDVPGLQQPGFGKAVRGFCQRLKGKQGRFRGNLSGKRVDFSGRTVISPDPNLGIDEVAVPVLVAVNMTYPERVNRYNIEKLRERVRNGKKHPGANFVIKKEGRKIFLEVLARYNKLGDIAQELAIGDIVERHLENGDIVLFNRQPSLHKLSILSHKAMIRPYRTFRLNECVCNPYNADFDGDEMNLHVLQTEEARTEAIELMGVKHNLATPKNGTPIIAAIQDFITAAYLLSSKDNFYDRKTFTHICSYMFNANSVDDPGVIESLGIDLPPPAIWKPQRLWTGKQVFNVLMRPNKKSPVLVNLDAPCKQYKLDPKYPQDLSLDDAWLVVRNSEVMCGSMDKSTVGDGKKDSVFYVILRDFGPDYAVQAMNRLAKLSSRWLSNQGFSIGIGDVHPSRRLIEGKKALVEKAYEECRALIDNFKSGKLARAAGCDEEQTMENKISGILSAVRQKAGDICFSELSHWNSPMIMAKCGSKGSNINVSQMVACVGQQIIGGSRVADGFQDRTLPHFPKGARLPASKGFVDSSFFSGLTPTEFIFHAMSGREGLVDTAVKTAETGYMSRRLMKSLEDLSAQYDYTVRNSSHGIVQFQYGDDQLDPVNMEGKAKPVNFERTFTHARTSIWDNNDTGLLPFEVRKRTADRLSTERKKLARISLLGTTLDYRDRSDDATDQLESARDFIDEVEHFADNKAQQLAEARRRVHLRPEDHSTLNDDVDMAAVDDDARTSVSDGIGKISASALDKFLTLCLEKHDRAKVEPGHAVGAVAAQSIGEPGTQMTLKTFHFAGVAGMSITQGVPRIKEIINASRNISTPLITCALNNPEDERVARLVKSRIEKTYLRDIIAYIEDVWSASTCYILMRVDWEIIDKLGLQLEMRDIEKAITKTRGLKLNPDSVQSKGHHLRVYLDDVSDGKKSGKITKQEAEEYFFRIQNLKRAITSIVIKGYPDASRAIIQKESTPNARGIYEVGLFVEGYGLRSVMNTEGVDGLRTKTNSILEIRDVLGIEAARKAIINEINTVMGAQMDIDPRHMQLLADVMTYKGEILGITRFGLAKMRDSVLQLASFEKTPDHLFDAAVYQKTDKIEGVSECIIMGQTMGIGTGAFQVVRSLNIEADQIGKKKTLFEDCFMEMKDKRSMS